MAAGFSGGKRRHALKGLGRGKVLKVLRSVVVTAAVSIPVLWGPSAQAEFLRILTENYPPFNYPTEDGEVAGLSTDIVRRILDVAKIDHSLTLLPWKRAYLETRRTANTCLYSTAETPDRTDEFRWIGPILENDWVLFTRKDQPMTIVDLADLKSLNVGGYVGDAITSYLREQGVNIDAARSEEQNLKKLLAGRIDVWPSGRVIGHYIAKKAGQADAIREVYRLRKVRVSMACNLDTSDKLIRKLRDALAKLRVSGELDMLQREIF